MKLDKPLPSSKTESMKLQSSKIGKRKLLRSGKALTNRSKRSSHALNWLMILTLRVKCHTVSKSSILISFPLESTLSKASKMSYSQRVSEAKKKEASEKKDWDASTTGEKRVSAEDKIASKIANEVLRDNAKLRAIHSGPSIKKLLEREAKKQMEAAAAGGTYEGPVISRIVEKDKRDKADPSNLPYLHKNPAI